MTMGNFDDVRRFDPNRFKMPSTEIWEKIRIIAKELGRTLGCRDPLTPEFIAVILLAIKVFDRKQRAYGPGNIAKFSDYGVLVRKNDKVERLQNLYKKGADPQEEGRDDSFGDDGVYSFIAIMCRWGIWPGVKSAADRDEHDIDRLNRDLENERRENERLREEFATAANDLDQLRSELLKAKEELKEAAGVFDPQN